MDYICSRRYSAFSVSFLQIFKREATGYKRRIVAVKYDLEVVSSRESQRTTRYIFVVSKGGQTENSPEEANAIWEERASEEETEKRAGENLKQTLRRNLHYLSLEKEPIVPQMGFPRFFLYPRTSAPFSILRRLPYRKFVLRDIPCTRGAR